MFRAGESVIETTTINAMNRRLVGQLFLAKAAVEVRSTAKTRFVIAGRHLGSVRGVVCGLLSRCGAHSTSSIVVCLLIALQSLCCVELLGGIDLLRGGYSSAVSSQASPSLHWIGRCLHSNLGRQFFRQFAVCRPGGCIFEALHFRG